MTQREKKVLKELINRFCTCLNNHQLCSFQFDKKLLQSLGFKNVETISPELELSNEIIYITYDKINSEKVKKFIERNKHSNIIIVISSTFKKRDSFSLSFIGSKLRLKIFGPIIFEEKKSVPKSFKVLAIIHVFNEEDIIEKTVKYLIEQGVHVYLLDNHSTDRTSAIIAKLLRKYHDRVFYQQFPLNKKVDKFEWYKQLQKTEQLSKTTNYNWYIHYDSDEYRVAPFPGVNLREFIYYVDQLGYTLIENTLIDFRIINESRNKNNFMKDTYFHFNHRPGAFVQAKTWKKDSNICLCESGGHLAQISNPKIFPIKILNRHYPLRYVQQANNKIFRDRLPRFSKEERKKGWHSQYDDIKGEKNYIYDRKCLIKWNNRTMLEYYLPLFFGVGIEYMK